MAGLIVAFVVGLVLFKLVKGVGLGQTAAFYIGIPTVLALILTLSAPSGRAIGMTIKAITILLLLAIPVLGEGFICVLIAAPLFYGVGIIVAWLVDRLRRRGGGVARIVVLPVVALALSAEGVAPAVTLPGDTAVAAHRTVAATPDEVIAALSRPLRFAQVAPTGVLALGFPRPRMDHGSGLAVGDRRTVLFDGAHHRPSFIAAHHWGEAPSQVEFEVVERGPNSVRMRLVSDTTPLATWLTWRSVDISWHSVDPGHTAISWALRYTRRLAPAWYFGPIERVVAQRAAAYLLDALDLGS
ncbi:hypothetical protein BKN37_11435 [Mycobacterium talmoniae]|uniref:Polyketide cyclase n=1 Tax=Mycobacterium talmoniae TaxID=1858794 RepID=A0A1S1NEV0_9MYCO|nr:hypothetical protein BKN37_11435 [Mycobacterium talmoniae]TDH56968.1 hypothetical protein E2F47_04680 [Mycobacterium eburneum]